MARTTVTHILDDIDGSTDATEVNFSFDGVDYSIDLGKKNRASFEKAISPYIGAARKLPKSGRSRRASSTPDNSRDLNAVRVWAKEQGLEVSERGRVAKTILDQYDAAH